MTKRLIAVLVPVLLAACAKSRSLDAVSTAGVACTSCHGDPSRPGPAPIQAAPPASPHGGNGGAHLAHLQRGVACGACHVVPSAPDHANGVVDVTFSGVAILKGASPRFSGGPDGTCSGVYCHGANLGAGGTLTPPAWSGGPLACNACHGNPPPNHAAGSTACAACHPGTVNADGTLNAAGGLHANGTVDVVPGHQAGWSDPTQHGYAAMTGLGTCRSCHGQNLDGAGGTGPSCASCHAADGYASWQSNCTFCHGTRQKTYAAANLNQAAPPAGTHGETQPTQRAVGAHQKHLAGGSLGAAVACTECHAVPTDLGHLDGSAKLTFGQNATRRGASPTFDGTSCAAVACHGAGLAGGSNTTPSWTGGGTQTTCGSCHGIPPPAPHTTSTSCGTCHTGYTATTVNAALHMNGAIDATSQHPAGWAAKEQHGYAANTQGLSACTGCHGTDFNGGTTGISCNACHTTSGWAAWQTNCTFCHGTRVAAYTSASLTAAAPPVGTEGESATTTRAVGAHQKHLTGGTIGPAVACATCHTVPADLGHVNGIALVTFGAPAKVGGTSPTWNGATCASVSCHGATLAGGSNTTPTWTGGSTQTTCGSCHGIPPPAPHSTSTSCGACHTGYTNATVNPSVHMNGTVDVTTQHPAGWAAKTQHGYAANSQGLSACTGCHGTDFNGGTTGISCNACHTTNGWAAWQTNCTFCHGTRVASYTSASLSSSAPPVGSQGETATTALAVGAHQKHLTGGTIGPAVACTTCHTVPTSLAHVNGTASVTLSGPAAQGGVSASWNATATTCATYCHGASLAGGSNVAPTWTGGSTQTTCGSCHGIPPPAPHTTSTSCGTCHTGYTNATVNPSLHMNGTVDAVDQHPAGWAAKEQHGYAANRQGLSACTGCHGTDFNGGTTGISCNACHTTNGWAAWQTNCTFCHGTRVTSYTSASLSSSAPPVGSQGETATTALAVGAHQKHLTGGTIGPAVACTTCHTVPTNLAHVNGAATVTLTGPAAQGGVTPSWNAAAATCATYCHGASLPGGSNTAPVWTGGSAQTTCGSCHGIPPPAPHSTSTSCGTCHAGYTNATVNASLHMNGTVDATSQHPAGWAAGTSHGTSANHTGFANCKTCHGANLDGVGGTGPSCTQCHADAGFANWATNCTFCHGNRSTGVASPPLDTLALSSTSNTSVGVHANHMGSTIIAALACTACHPDRTGSNVITDPNHVDGNGIAEITFGAQAKLNGAAPSYNRASATSATCASVYCHSNGYTASLAFQPMQWAAQTPVTLSCSGCHGAPPSTGRHATHAGEGIGCDQCHPGYTGTTVNRATHIDGTVQVGNKITSWTPSTGRCVGCHGSATW